MPDKKKQYTPIAALRAFFGYLPEQGLKEFGEEVKRLTYEEKMYLAGKACEEMGAELVERSPAPREDLSV